MIHQIHGHTRLYKIRKEIIREKLEVTPIGVKWVKLDWDGLNTSREEVPIHLCVMIDNEGYKIGWGKPKRVDMRWLTQIYHT